MTFDGCWEVHGKFLVMTFVCETWFVLTESANSFPSLEDDWCSYGQKKRY